MAHRVCQFGPCRVSLDGAHPKRLFCTDVHRKASKRVGSGIGVPVFEGPVSTEVVDALGVELRQLGVADTYEGRVALGIAAQLDKGTVIGAAYASLSKELDRRVDALRLKAERPDDPVRLITGAVEEKRATLRSV